MIIFQGGVIANHVIAILTLLCDDYGLISNLDLSEVFDYDLITAGVTEGEDYGLVSQPVSC